jgi:hypothetical protein
MTIPVAVDGGKIEELIGQLQAKRRHRMPYMLVATEAKIDIRTLNAMRRGESCRFVTLKRFARYLQGQGIVVFVSDLIVPIQGDQSARAGNDPR